MESNNLDRTIGKRPSKDLEGALMFGIKDQDKIEKFEGILTEVFCTSDSISEAVEKMVTAALTVEFGESLLKKDGAKNMVSTISRSIISDSELRKQSLIIMDRFAKPTELNA
ncbi:MAG: hypothetical protein NTZ10_04580 [Candidatus Saganbacteria bacterium]|nr:hypothetical protein [Candidatus Saganbacteria bacterium]